MINSDKNIVLIGMPGCGKSTIGAEVSAILNRTFYDLDSIIEKREGEQISKIFSKGEDYFRTVETQVVTEISETEKSVISTGGGVIKREENIKLLKKNGIVIFINRPIMNILGDIDTSNRPLLRNSRESLLRLYDERIGLYTKYSDIEIINDQNLKDVIENIILLIK